MQRGQQGPLDPERGVRVSSWAAILALRVWRASLLSPRATCLAVQWKEVREQRCLMLSSVALNPRASHSVLA